MVNIAHKQVVLEGVFLPISFHQVPAFHTVRGEARFPQPRQQNQTTVGRNLGKCNQISYNLQVYSFNFLLVGDFARTETDQNYEELKKLQDFLISSFPWVFKDSKVFFNFQNFLSDILSVCGTLFSKQLQHPPTSPRFSWDK